MKALTKSAALANASRIAVMAMLVVLASNGFAQSAGPSGLDYLKRASEHIRNLDTAQLRAMLVRQPELVLVDVRTSEELATLGGTIATSQRVLNINRGWIEFRIGGRVPDVNTPIVVFCGINQRSPLAAETLERLGYKQVYNYADGFFAWRDAGLPVALADEAPGTMLYRRPVQVADGVWSAIGATAAPTMENSGHNNNLSFIITGAGVVVVNAGDNYLLAQSLHEEIRARTDEPVKYVILENGQGHAMLGSIYWQAQGAKVIAHVDAAAEIEAHGHDIIDRMRRRNRDKAMGTELTKPDITFEQHYVIELGDARIELLNLGPAHSPGDIVVWLPRRKVAISGDMAFHQRLLPVFETTDTAAWIESWENFVKLGAQTVIPGHGAPTNMAPLTRYTVGYLRYMRAQIGQIIDAGGTLQEAYGVDQSPYAHLDTFDELARLNAGRIFRAMEFE
jgi:glyoxylase-like metal-dependent hydrolase (beta-lactamase superfamily II)/rhodanese-related sulfurtransferase